MIRWIPDTCFCIILCPRPSIAGSFEKRCRIHKRSSSTLLVYQFNLDNRILPSELISFTIRSNERPQSLRDQIKQLLPFVSYINPDDRPQVRVTEAGEQRIRDLKESTRP